MNVGGIGTKVEKRKTLIESVKNTNDITILTETKFRTDNIQTLRQEWNGKSIHSTATNARAGVSILFKKGLAFELSSSNDGDNEGRILWAEIKISSKNVLVIGVYGKPWCSIIDEFLEKFQTAFDPPPPPPFFGKNVAIFSKIHDDQH